MALCTPFIFILLVPVLRMAWFLHHRLRPRIQKLLLRFLILLDCGILSLTINCFLPSTWSLFLWLFKLILPMNAETFAQGKETLWDYSQEQQTDVNVETDFNGILQSNNVYRYVYILNSGIQPLPLAFYLVQTPLQHLIQTAFV